jgi:hypothetical protein
MTLERKIELLKWYDTLDVILPMDRTPSDDEMKFLYEYLMPYPPQHNSYLNFKGKAFLAAHDIS